MVWKDTSCWSQYLGHQCPNLQICSSSKSWIISHILHIGLLGASCSLVRKTLLMKIPRNLKCLLQIPLDFKMALYVYFQTLEDWNPQKIPINFSDLNHLRYARSVYRLNSASELCWLLQKRKSALRFSLPSEKWQTPFAMRCLSLQQFGTGISYGLENWLSQPRFPPAEEHSLWNYMIILVLS